MQTSKMCKRCKIMLDINQFNKLSKSKDGLQSNCRPCFKDINAANYRENANTKKQKTSNYYYANLDKCREMRKEWRLENRDHKRTKDREYYSENREDIIARATKWNEDNYNQHNIHMRNYNHSEGGKEARAAWNKNNAEKLHLYKHNYKAKRRQWEDSGWTIKIGWWRALIKQYNDKCAYCGIDGLIAPKYFKNGVPIGWGLTPEHMAPLSVGGLHSPENIVPACMKCQGHKQSKTVTEYGVSPKVWF